MNFCQSARITASHPSLKGHFPGNPIVPGVGILDTVQQAIEAWQGNIRPKSLPTVKFMNPLLPEHEYMINLQMNEAAINTIKFTCVEGNTIIAQGSMTFYRNN